MLILKTEENSNMNITKQIRKVQKYITSDDKVFDNFDEATQHELLITLVELLWDRGQYLDKQEALENIIEYQNSIKELLYSKESYDTTQRFIQMNPAQARWLKAVMQNPMTEDGNPELEDLYNRDMRKYFWDQLIDLDF